jgi:hypothetical protein
MVFNHSKFGKKGRKKETNVMVSNMHVTHISLLFFGFVFGCLAYDFRQVEKKCISLVTCFIHILWSRRSFEFGEFEDGFIA